MDNKHGRLPGVRMRRQNDCLGGAFRGLASRLMAHLSRDERKGQRSLTLVIAGDLRDRTASSPRSWDGEKLQTVWKGGWCNMGYVGQKDDKGGGRVRQRRWEREWGDGDLETIEKHLFCHGWHDLELEKDAFCCFREDRVCPWTAVAFSL